jgi:hypothetical protein
MTMRETQRLSIGRWRHLVLAVLCAALPWATASSAQAACPCAGILAPALVAQGDYGTIKGRLVWGGTDVPPPYVLAEKGKAAKDPDVCAKDEPIVAQDLVVDQKTKGVAHGFAYLIRPSGANPDAVQSLLSKSPKVELDQANCTFIPRSLPFHQNQTLVLKSSDPKNHNVRFSGFNNAGFNQILPPNGQLETKLVAERVPVVVACDIHSWMKAHLMVFDHPFFATTGTDGSFEIKGVPPGRQNLIVWQETVGYATPGLGRGMPVSIEAGKVADVGEIKLDPARVKRTVPAPAAAR